jgi:hypothetical protein
VARRGELPGVLRRAEPEIGPVMQAVATSEPEIVFWTKLDTRDDFGWEGA